LLSGFDERDAAVMEMMRMAIMACKQQGKYVSICGQAPSDFPELAEWLFQSWQNGWYSRVLMRYQ